MELPAPEVGPAWVFGWPDEDGLEPGAIVDPMPDVGPDDEPGAMVETEPGFGTMAEEPEVVDPEPVAVGRSVEGVGRLA